MCDARGKPVERWLSQGMLLVVTGATPDRDIYSMPNEPESLLYAIQGIASVALNRALGAGKQLRLLFSWRHFLANDQQFGS